MTPKLFLSFLLTLAMSPTLLLADDSKSNTTDSITNPATTNLTQLVPVGSTDLRLPSDRLLIETNGSPTAYFVSKNEFYRKDRLTGETNIESLAEDFSSAEEMREFVRDEDSVWGQDCMLVLYTDSENPTAENRRMLTHKIEIKLDLEVASMQLLHQLAAAVGVEVGSDKIGRSGSAWLRADCGGSAIKAAELLSLHESVLRARPILTLPMVQAVGAGPNDQYFNGTNQYYIHPSDIRNINVLPVWCGDALLQRYFGRNILISILDDGVEGEHPELDRGYQYGKDTDFVDGDNDGRPGSTGANHGTAMAGIIGGRQNNGVGVAGIAPAAKLFSTRVFGADSDPNVLSEAIEHEKGSVDVVVLGFVAGGDYIDIGDILEDTFEEMAERKDVPICYPAGSGGGNSRADYDRAVSNRHTIATGALESETEEGSSIIVTAPSVEMTTTDLTGADGAELGDYFFDFGGTSASNACTSGVIALMKDARSDLGWRDYQEILLLTSIPLNSQFNGEGVATPIGNFGFHHNYLWGAGLLDAHTAVRLSEVWARLPDSAVLYKASDHRERIREDIGLLESEDIAAYFADDDGDGEIDRTIPPARTFLFDFNREVPSKRNLRIEHIEVRLEWEEAPSGAPAILLPASVSLCSPYYLNGPSNPDVDGIDDRDDAMQSIMSAFPVNAPREWTYTTVRHWGQVNTGGFDRLGVPDQENRTGGGGSLQREVVEAGVWELTVNVQPLIVDSNYDNPSSKPFRRLIEAEITMYGSENNVPPTVVSANLSSSGNPGVIEPRTAFEDEDLIVSDIVLFDPEGDALTIGYTWQVLDEDGLTWVNLGDTVFESSLCEFDQFIRIETKPDVEGRTYGRYFFLYELDGTEVGFYFQDPDSTEIDIPLEVTTSDRIIAITGVVEDEGAIGIAADVERAINTDIYFSAQTDTFPDGDVAVIYPIGTGNIPLADPATSNFDMTREAAPRPDGNCTGVTAGRLDSSETIAGNKYRVIITPRDGLREGFRFVSDDIIVNSRPVYEAAHGFPYFYDVDMWILTVPPEDLSPFLFINELSQGTGDTNPSTTNREWVEIVVNFTTDLRGYKVSNDIANFDITFTNSPIWEEVTYGTIITIYNDSEPDTILPPQTPISDFGITKSWVLSSASPLLVLPSNGDGWGEFSNIDCTIDGRTCNGAHAGLLSQFDARDPIHGVSFNGNGRYVDAGIATAGISLYFDGTSLLPGVPDQEPFSPMDSGGWRTNGAEDATPGAANSNNNQAILDVIEAEAKTSVPTYRFYPGDGTQFVISPINGRPIISDATGLEIPDLVASDEVPGLTIDRKTGVISGTPNVFAGGTFTIKVQRWHSFSSEIQIYQLTVLPSPPLDDDEDEDGDGVNNLLEEALGTDAYDSLVNELPFGEVVTAGGMNYQSISFRRLRGGILDPITHDYTIDNLLYTVEASTDLRIWRSAPEAIIVEESVVNSLDDPENVEVVNFRIVDAFNASPNMRPITSEGEFVNRYYLRLRVTRLP